MTTGCSEQGTLFPGVAGRDAVVRFDAGDVSSNGGVLLLDRADRRVALTSRFAACFRDHRDQDRIEHTARQLVAQRVFGLCLGYEDVSDHDAVGKDPLLAAACGKKGGDLAAHATLWCEAAGHFHVIGVARNPRLQAQIADALDEAKALFGKSGAPERVFRDFDWTTVDTWSRVRRVVAKAEHLAGGKPNPRFIVTNLPRRSWSAKRLYEQLDCARGEAENRTKEQQPGLFGTRLSTPTLSGNAVRMAMSAAAYALTCALRRLGLVGSEMAEAQADTIRLRLLRIGALVWITARKVWVSMSASWPWKDVFRSSAARLLAPAHVT